MLVLRGEGELIRFLVTAKAIDVYIASKGVTPSSSADVVPVDARLEAIVERMFERCEKDGEHKQVRAAFPSSKSRVVLSGLTRSALSPGPRDRALLAPFGCHSEHIRVNQGRLTVGMGSSAACSRRGRC